NVTGLTGSPECGDSLRVRSIVQVPEKSLVVCPSTRLRAGPSTKLWAGAGVVLGKNRVAARSVAGRNFMSPPSEGSSCRAPYCRSRCPFGATMTPCRLFPLVRSGRGRIARHATDPLRTSQRVRHELRVHVLGYFLHFAVSQTVNPAVGVVVRLARLGRGVTAALDNDVGAVGDQKENIIYPLGRAA